MGSRLAISATVLPSEARMLRTSWSRPEMSFSATKMLSMSRRTSATWIVTSLTIRRACWRGKGRARPEVSSCAESRLDSVRTAFTPAAPGWHRGGRRCT